MQRLTPLTPRDRASTIGAVVLIHLALLAALIAVGRVTILPVREEAPLQTFTVRTPALSPVHIRHALHSARPAAEASMPNLRSDAAPVVAPTPLIALPVAAPIVVSETPAIGTQPTQGAALLAGTGTAAGGSGAGAGAGGSGNGTDGAGSGGGIAFGPRQIAGAISRRDYPSELRAREVPYEEVALQYRIGVDGFVRDCRVLQSSGSPLLDQRTCQLYEQRYRYLPARDAAGQPVEIVMGAIRSWALRH